MMYDILYDFNSSKVINNQDRHIQHVCEKFILCDEKSIKWEHNLQLTNITDYPSPMTTPNVQTKDASKIWDFVFLLKPLTSPKHFLASSRT